MTSATQNAGSVGANKEDVTKELPLLHQTSSWKEVRRDMLQFLGRPWYRTEPSNDPKKLLRHS